MKNKKTLLERARELDKNAQRAVFSSEECELVKAWLDGDLRLKSLRKVAVLKSDSQAYVFISRVCRYMHMNNK